MGKCIIFCAAEFDGLLQSVSPEDYVIAADGGLRHQRYAIQHITHKPQLLDIGDHRQHHLHGRLTQFKHIQLYIYKQIENLNYVQRLQSQLLHSIR